VVLGRHSQEIAKPPRGRCRTITKWSGSQVVLGRHSQEIAKPPRGRCRAITKWSGKRQTGQKRYTADRSTGRFTASAPRLQPIAWRPAPDQRTGRLAARRARSHEIQHPGANTRSTATSPEITCQPTIRAGSFSFVHQGARTRQHGVAVEKRFSTRFIS